MCTVNIKHLKILSFIIFWLITQLLNAQNTFWNSYDMFVHNDQGWTVMELNDGYLINVASFCIGGNDELWNCHGILKVDKNGKFIWQKQVNKSKEHFDIGLSNLSLLGETIVVGSGKWRNDSLRTEIYIEGRTQEGNLIWDTEYGSEGNNGVRSLIVQDSTIITLQTRYHADDNRAVPWIKKIDTTGKCFIDTVLGVNPKYELIMGSELIITSDSGYLVSGMFHRPDPQFAHLKSILWKLNKKGKVQWAQEYDSISIFNRLTVNIAAVDTGLFAVGQQTSVIKKFSDYWKPTIFVVDADGNKKWQHVFDKFVDTSSHELHSVHASKNHDIIGVGYVSVRELGNGSVGWVFRMDKHGKIKWQKYLIDDRFKDDTGRRQSTLLNDIIEDNQGNLIITGSMQDTFPEEIPVKYNTNILLIKLDSNGCFNAGCGEVQYFSDIISAVETPTNERVSMTISPNPSTGIFDIGWISERSLSAYIEVWNTKGVFVHSQQLNGGETTELNLSGQPSGIYFIVLKNEFGQIIDKQLINIQKK